MGSNRGTFGGVAARFFSSGINYGKLKRYELDADQDVMPCNADLIELDTTVGVIEVFLPSIESVEDGSLLLISLTTGTDVPMISKAPGDPLLTIQQSLNSFPLDGSVLMQRHGNFWYIISFMTLGGLPSTNALPGPAIGGGSRSSIESPVGETIDIPAAATFVPMTSGGSYPDMDPLISSANGPIVIVGAFGGGVYDAYADSTVLGEGGALVHMGVEINGTVLVGTVASTEFDGEGVERKTLASRKSVTLLPADVIKLAFTSNTNDDDVLVYDAHLHLERRIAVG